MTDYVWVSTVMSNASLIAMTTTDISERDIESSIAGVNALKAGEPVDPLHLPQSIYMDKGKKANLPPVFDANGYYIVNGTVADILSRYDLGEGGLYPVKVWQSDRATQVEGPWFCWVFGNLKSAFTKANSVNMLDRGPAGGEWARMPYSPADFEVAVTSEALSGPDVWLDLRLFKTVFMSRELGDELAAANLGQFFELYRAKIV